MPQQEWILTLSGFAIGTAEFVIAGILTDVADTLRIAGGQASNLIRLAAQSWRSLVADVERRPRRQEAKPRG